MSESTLYPSPWSSSPQNHVDSFLGSRVSLISNDNLRYEGIIFHLNLHDSTLGLQNVICYGTEGRSTKEFQIPPFNQVYSYILFNENYIKEIVVKHPMGFLRCGYGSLARGDTSSKLCHATKPPFPVICSSYNPPSVNDRLQIDSYPPLAHPQFPANPPQSLFTTFPPAPISLQQISGGFDFEAMYKNSKQYEIWGPPENNNQREEENAKPAANSIDGSFYMISRNPFEPIATPYNPLGPIARPVKPTEELQRRTSTTSNNTIQFQRGI